MGLRAESSGLRRIGPAATVPRPVLLETDRRARLGIAPRVLVAMTDVLRAREQIVRQDRLEIVPLVLVAMTGVLRAREGIGPRVHLERDRRDRLGIARRVPAVMTDVLRNGEGIDPRDRLEIDHRVREEMTVPEVSGPVVTALAAIVPQEVAVTDRRGVVLHAEGRARGVRQMTVLRALFASGHD